MAVVFSDTFTVGADTRLDQYPSAGSPDYAYTPGEGATTDITVNAATDRARQVATTRVSARIIHAGIPTGDYQISIDINGVLTSVQHGGLCARMSASAADYYLLLMRDDVADQIQLWREDAGSGTKLSSFTPSPALDVSQFHTLNLKVTGAGATVTLEYWVDALGHTIFGDSDANRKTSGPPGISVDAASANLIEIDNLSIDDLVTGSPKPWIE